MSGVKYVAPNYQQLYQDQLAQNQQQNQRNRELERQVREQEVVAAQVAQSEARLHRDIEVTQAASRQAAAEMVRLHEMQRNALNEMGNVRVQLRVTHDTLNTMRWENQTMHTRSLELQREVRDLAERNRDEILRNRVELQNGFESIEQRMQQLGNTLEVMQKRKEAEDMRTAAQLLETAVNARYFISDEMFQRFNPEGYVNATRLFNQAQTQFQAKSYQAAAAIGSELVGFITDAVTFAEQRYNAHKAQRERAMVEYDAAARTVHGLDNADVRLWMPQALFDLQKAVSALDDLVKREQFEQLETESRAVTVAASHLAHDVDAAAARHVERTTVARSLVESLLLQGAAEPEGVTLVDVDEPMSDIVITTDGGPSIYVPMQGEIRFEFPQEKSDENLRWIKQLGQAMQEKQVVRDLRVTDAE